MKKNSKIGKQDDFDSPWKEILQYYFSDFMAFFFPIAYQDIEWSRNYEFLDKELQKVVRDSELGKRLVDKLVKVWLKDGEESWILVHIEVQTQKDEDFTKRMYVYNYRKFDKQNHSVVSLAILGDEHPSWKPDQFRYGRWGCEAGIRFPVIKLLDYRDQWNDLEKDPNPFAVVVMAHLKTQETRNNYLERKKWKFNIAKALYERGYQKDDIIRIFKFIDWMMFLPEELQASFWDDILEYEEEKKMPYVLSIERIATEKGIERGIRKSLIKALELRFEAVPKKLIDTINNITNMEILEALYIHAIKCKSIKEFEEKIKTTV
jgi:glycosyltransferase involved in cell wall biosynthesis